MKPEEMRPYLAEFIRIEALQLMVHKDDRVPLDRQFAGVVLRIREECDHRLRMFEDKDVADIRAQCTQSIAMIQESLAEIIADWRDGVAPDVLTSDLERQKMIWYDQLPIGKS